MFFDLITNERIQSIILGVFVYMVFITLVALIVVSVIKRKKIDHGTKTITSNDVFSSDERLEDIEISSAKLGRENHREFPTDIFDTIKSGLDGNDNLALISDCDEESI